MSKYGNRKTEIEGYIFDSLAEGRRYSELVIMEKNGDISSLAVHPVYLLQPAFKYNGKTERKIEYEADFEYMSSDGWKVVEDCKGFKTKEYSIKRKLFLMKYPEVKFMEVTA